MNIEASLFLFFIIIKTDLLRYGCIYTDMYTFCLYGILPTVLILSFRTDRSEQTVQTQIGLFLEEQSDQGLHCLPFRLHRLDSLLYGRAT